MRTGSHIFPKELRLLKNSEFVSAAKGAVRVHTNHFLMLWAPRAHHTCRLGITVTRKVANAVGRNRIKRCIREAFRLARPHIQLQGDLVVIAKRGAQKLSSDQTASEFKLGLVRLSQRKRGASV